MHFIFPQSSCTLPLCISPLIVLFAFFLSPFVRSLAFFFIFLLSPIKTDSANFCLARSLSHSGITPLSWAPEWSKWNQWKAQTKGLKFGPVTWKNSLPVTFVQYRPISQTSALLKPRRSQLDLSNALLSMFDYGLTRGVHRLISLHSDYTTLQKPSEKIGLDVNHLKALSWPTLMLAKCAAD